MLSVFVPGRPATLTATHQVAETWKRQVAATVSGAWQRPFFRAPMAAELRFTFPEHEIERVALHNLLKSTIDGLSLPVFAPGSHGHQTDWNREDGWICELLATKGKGPSGVQIVLSHVDLTPVTPPIVNVPGRPAPWVTRAEANWKADVSSAARSARFPTPPAQVSMVFRIDPAHFWTTDLDNLVVPVVGALSPVRGSAIEVRGIHAWKEEPSDAPLGLDLWSSMLRSPD